MAETVLLGEAAPPPIVSERQETLPWKYSFPLFAGPGGERYLKKLLRQILPAALYRTWEIFAEHQAQGNDCFLSLTHMATLAGRSLRTIQKCVASLQAKGLLVERVERKTFLTADGSPISRMVLIKDFTALYALAQEYDAWLHDDEYVPAERCFIRTLTQNPALVAKLRRFDNYRKILYTRVPGPGRQLQEEDRWFTQYRPDAMMNPLHETTAVQPSHVSAPALNLTAKKVSKEVSKETPKRITESSHRDDRLGDSYDSASSISKKPWKEKDDHVHQSPQQPRKNERRSGSKHRSESVLHWPPHQDNPACLKQHPHGGHTAPMGELSKAGQTIDATREERTFAIEDQAHQPWFDRASGGFSVSPPPDHPLARSFLTEIATPLGDQNVKGSITHILRVLANASLMETEVLLCLVRAYTIARDMRTIHARYVDQHTGQVNRMPLFCTLVERFAQARIHQNRWTYSWSHMENDLVADNHLCIWWSHHQDHFAQVLPDPCNAHPPSEPPPQEEQGDPPPCILGWAYQDGAHEWGELLLEALLKAGYEAEVCVHQEDQWYQLVLRAEENEYILATPQQVHYVIKQVNRAKREALSPHSAFQRSRTDTARSKLRQVSNTA